MWWGYVFCVMRKCQSVDSIDSITSNFTATYFGQYCTRTCWLWPVLELSSSPPDVPVTRGWLGRACQETRSPTLALALLSLLAPTSVRDRQLRRPQGKRRDYFLRKSIFSKTRIWMFVVYKLFSFEYRYKISQDLNIIIILISFISLKCATLFVVHIKLWT